MKIIIWIAIIAMVAISIVVVNIGDEEIEQLQRYWDVEIGMTEDEMLDIMGDGFNRSLLKNNRKKYEWRINARSYGTSYKGVSTRTYSGVKKVTIYTKDGFVEEVKPYNV